MTMKRMIRVGVIILSSLLFATVLSVPVDLQVGVDPNRPVTLYEAPPTYRRDARGRPFKSIIIRANPFGFNRQSDQQNAISDHLSAATTTTTTTTTTTEKPDDNKSPITTATTPPKTITQFKSIIVTSKPFGLDSNSIRDQSTTTVHAFKKDFF